MARDANVRQAIENEWIRFVLLHPQTGALSVYAQGSFVPYRRSGRTLKTFGNSYDVFRGQRDHLDYALISSGLLPEDSDDRNALRETQEAGANR